MVCSLWQRSQSYRQPGDRGNSFEPFVYTWIAFNAWAECVTDEERDSEWIRILSSNEHLARQFNACVSKEAGMREALNQFVAFWPVPKVQDWRRNRPYEVVPFVPSERARFFSSNSIAMAPECWLDHHERDEMPPSDWLHFLYAVYRVRCNLFHGEKNPFESTDQQIVRSAFLVLAYFLERLEEFAPVRDGEIDPLIRASMPTER